MLFIAGHSVFLAQLEDPSSPMQRTRQYQLLLRTGVKSKPFWGRPSPTSAVPSRTCTPPPPEPLVGPSISGLAFSPGCCSPATSLGFPLRLLSVIYVSEASGSGNISLPRESFCVWGSESSPFVAAASLSWRQWGGLARYRVAY